MMSQEKIGVVCFQLGGPDSPDAVEPFLYNLFCDPDIIDFPGAFLARRALARLISSRRSGPVRERYRQIGGKSPIIDLTMAQGGVLWAVRLAILGVAISGAWQLLLAPFSREHFAYPLSGWYVVAAAGTVAVVGVIRAGWTLPPSGLLCIMLAATCFLFARLCSALPSRLGARDEDPPPGPQ